MDKKKNYELAFVDYKAGMSYQEIANKYGVTLAAVRAWQVRHFKRMEAGESDIQNIHDMQSDNMPVDIDNYSAPTAQDVLKSANKQIINKAEIDRIMQYSRDNLPSISTQQEEFVREYISTLSSRAAAINSGYSVAHADSIGSQLLSNDKVASHIQVAMALRSARTDVNADKTIRELARIALCNPTDALNADGSINRDASRDDLAAICSVETKRIPTKAGVVIEQKVRFHDKNKAIELLMKAQGMMLDRKQLDVNITTNTTDADDLKARIKALELDQAGRTIDI